MIKFIISVLIISLFSACSFKSEPNEWKYKSINAFSSYTSNFLSNRDALAKSDLKRALTHAKQSANLTQLSRIYLGECALNISVGIYDKCLKYKEISELVDDESLNSYYKFINSRITKAEIKTLKDPYKDFATNLVSQDFAKAKENMFNMDKITSKLLSASLIKNKLNFDEVEMLIEDASFYGYKKSVIFWLNIQKSKTTSKSKIKIIDKKIKVLG